MKETIGACVKNPRQTGHCDHQSVVHRPGGVVTVQTCCWCGRSHEQFIKTPDHGPHVIEDERRAS